MKINLFSIIEEIFIFTYKQSRACIFAVLFFLLLYFSHYIPFFGMLRYDRIFLGALLIQAILYFTKIETKDELKVIFIFHIVGLVLEIFKTSPQIRAWSYPEEGYLKIAGVPLYSGFMYAAVASYMVQSWKLLKLRLLYYPSYWLTIPLILLVYINFFTHHFFPDIRWILIAIIFLIFYKTKVIFIVLKKKRYMPAVLAFALIGFFIFIAENISTFLGAWQYPSQTLAWNPVHPNKISSWFLFTIISFMIVADLKHFRGKREF